MKATIEIPDELYRSVKARSALEGRTLRSVAVELFHKWLDQRPEDPLPNKEPISKQELAEFPWLAIAMKHVKPGISSEMADIRESIERGWAKESAET
jgi:hypothetical protein